MDRLRREFKVECEVGAPQVGVRGWRGWGLVGLAGSRSDGAGRVGVWSGSRVVLRVVLAPCKSGSAAAGKGSLPVHLLSWAVRVEHSVPHLQRE